MVDIFSSGNPIVVRTAGLRGPAGPGFPAGGVGGQYLRKQTSDDFETEWSDVPQTDIAGLVAALAAKAPLLSPELAGAPKAPTAPLGTNTDQIATMAAIKAAIDALVDGAPGALDTLNELAAALADDASFAATITAALAGKQPIDALLTAIAALTTANNKLAYFTGADAVALTDLTAFGRTLIALSDAAGARAALDVMSSAEVTAALARSSGVWTPAFTFATPGDIAFANVVAGGVWWRTGNIFSFVGDWSGDITYATASGAAAIAGLPVSSATGIRWWPVTLGMMAQVDVGTTARDMSALVDGGDNRVKFRQNTDTGAGSGLTHTAFPSGTTGIQISVRGEFLI